MITLYCAKTGEPMTFKYDTDAVEHVELGLCVSDPKSGKKPAAPKVEVVKEEPKVEAPAEEPVEEAKVENNEMSETPKRRAPKRRA